MAATDLERLVVQLEAQSTKLDKALSGIVGNVDRQLNRVERRTDQMSQRVTAGFGRAGRTIAGFLSVRAVVQFIDRLSDAADKLQALSDRTGVGTDQLQKLAGAAAKANVDTEQLNDALDIFARNVGRAASGQGDLAKLFKDLNITARDDLVGTLLEVADKVQKAKTRTEEYRIVTAALGRSSVELVGFLRQGRDAIQSQMDAFRDGISPQAIKNLADFNQHWKEISVSFTNMAAGPLASVLKGLSDFLHDIESGTALQRLQSIVSLLSFGLVSPPDTRPFTQALSEIERISKEIDQRQRALSALKAEGVTGPVISDIQAELDALIKSYQTAYDKAVQIKNTPLPTPSGPVNKPFGGDANPEADAEAKKKADIEKQIAQDAFDVQQHFLAEEVQALRDAAALEVEIRQSLFDVQQGLWEDEAAGLADFHERAEAAWDDYYLRLADKRQEDADVAAEQQATLGARQLDAVREIFANLATLTQTGNEKLVAIGKAAAIVTATIDGIQAVQKALASVPPPLNFALAASVGVAAAVNVAKIAAMEKGGIVGPGGPMPLKRYARGGVATGPQMALFGEGSMNEAFVPLQDGRSIPVTLKVPEIPRNASQSSFAQTFHIDARGAQRGAAEEFEEMFRRVGPQLTAQSLAVMKKQLPDMIRHVAPRKL